LKVETRLQELCVAHTIVVFGGTRIRQPQVAQRAVEACARELAASPNNAERHL